MQKYLKQTIRAGLIASLYTALTLVVFPVASGSIQVRISEAFTLLPLLYVEAIPALAVGCLISNMLTGCAPLDVILGSLVTLVSAVMTYGVGKIFKSTALKIIFGGLFPVLLNAFLLPLIWLWAYGTGEYVYILQVAFLLVGQTLSVYAVGTPLYLAMKKRQKDIEKT